MTNEEAKGYCIMAMHNAGIPYNKIKEVLQNMKSDLDFHTESEAERRGNEILGELARKYHGE